jgi:hypothetical protein
MKLGDFARAIANCRNCTNKVVIFGRASPRLRLDSCHDFMKVTALPRNFLARDKQGAAVRPNHRRESLESPMSAELTIAMNDSGMLRERLNSASSLRARFAFFIPAPRTLSRTTVKPLLQRARSSAVFHPSPRPDLSLAEGVVSPSARSAGGCYALLRMRPLSNSWAECFVVISCGKVDYDKSG